VEKCIGGGRLTSNVTWTPTFRKEQLSTSCGPNGTRFLVVQVAIHAKMQCDKKSLLAAADASKKRNLMAVGGHVDNVVDLCAEDNADGKRQCLGNGQTMLTKQPSQTEFEECWSEVIIKNGLSPSLVDDPLFRKPSSQPLVWVNQPCAWARELHLERGTPHCHIVIHSVGKLFQ
jgi:hypothetical protein